MKEIKASEGYMERPPGDGIIYVSGVEEVYRVKNNTKGLEAFK